MRGLACLLNYLDLFAFGTRDSQHRLMKLLVVLERGILAQQLAADFVRPGRVAAVDGLLFWLASYWVLDTYERHVLRQILKRVFRST